jgi:flagellar basal-body rod modification protein FlgD
MPAIQAVTPSFGGLAASRTSTASAPGQTLGKDDFLKLLITQLRNQDPLNPLDQNQFLAQTAQFTSLEHLQNIAGGIEGLSAVTAGAALTQGAALLGRTARVSARDFAYDGATPIALPFALDARAAQVALDVQDASGATVRRLSTGVVDAGASSVTWDGLDGSGRPMAAGTYTYRVSALGDGGGAGPRAVVAEGVVDGLELRGTSVVYRLGTLAVRQDAIVDVR